MRRKLLLLTAIVVVLAMVVVLSAGCGNKKPTTEDKPAVSGVVPESGPAGTQIKIIGGEFGSTQGNSVVHVGTKEAEVSSWEDGLIAATVPDGLDPTTQPVTVMTDKGESGYIEFTVVEKPSDQPDSKEHHIETVSAEQAM
ncbi:MAG: IPT/TIG domain-containing protein, partial [Actinobacteria bacterium]|nr:IPT/TIG domain-containing protein [Actinomycetota bacterium]